MIKLCRGKENSHERERTRRLHDSIKLSSIRKNNNDLAVDREIPPRLEGAGKSGRKDECLAYIQEVWTDMRPLSLRKKMEEMEQQSKSEQE